MNDFSDLNDCSGCITKTHPLFSQLSEKELHQISLSKVTKTYPRGSIIYREGTRIRGFYCVQSGIVKIYKTGFDGKDQIIRLAKTGDLMGYRSAVTDEPACTTTQVLQESTLCLIPAGMLINLIMTNGDFAIQLMKLTCKELGEANSFLTDIAQKSVRERLAEVLLHLQREFGEDPAGILKILLTREELSNMVGTATESIIRLLSEFRNDGLIELNGRKIKILDRPGLMHVANI